MLHFSQLLLAFHLLAMMVASAGPVVALWLEWRGRGETHDMTGEVARRVAWHALVLLSIGMLLGFIVGLIFFALSQRDYQVILTLLRRRILWGSAELVFSFVLMLAYATGWRWCRSRSGLVRAGHRALAVLASTNLLYHFPPLMIVMTQLATAGSGPVASEPLDAEGFRQLAWHAEVLVSSLHFAVASFVIAGVWAAVLGNRLPGDDSGTAQLSVRASSGIALVAAGLQFPVGLWLLLSLPSPRQRELMGAAITPTLGLFVSVLLAVGLLHLLASATFGESNRRTPRLALAVAACIVVAMVITKYNS